MELNRERIIRGLACCKGSYDCFTCDIYKRGCAGFREGLAKDALSLIKELTEERDGLENLVKTSIETQNRMSETIEELTEENERLENALIEQSAENVMLCGEVKYARADTVRKMQSELKKTFSALCKGEMNDLYRIIDQIAKEMVEGAWQKTRR